MDMLVQLQVASRTYTVAVVMVIETQIVREYRNLLLLIISFSVPHCSSKESHLVTYQSGATKTQVDYVLYSRKLCMAVTNVKVISG